MKHSLLIGIGLGCVVISACAAQHAPLFLAMVCFGWALALTCLVLSARSQSSRDLVPDYLILSHGKFFECDGFCFGISMEREDRVATFTVMFQSRFLGRSTARIALRPVGAGVATISPEIKCGPAGFGVAKFPVAIPLQHQGKTVTFEIGADADYPQGKGRELRFHSGQAVRHDTQFASVDFAVRATTHRFARHQSLSGPAKISLKLPTDVAEYLPHNVAGGSEVLWTCTTTDRLPYAMER